MFVARLSKAASVSGGDRSDDAQTYSKGRFAALFLIAATLSGCAWLDRSADSQPGPPVNQQDQRQQPSQRPALESYASTVERVSPAVVSVRSERRVRAPRQYPFLNDPAFREFLEERFGGRTQQQPPRVQRGLGSGVIVSPDGYILTNHHVIDGANEIAIELLNRQVYEARVVGSDPPSDLAVLKIDANDLPTVPLGNSDTVKVGDVVLAVGNPLGLEQTVTAGIISAKGRSTGVSDGSFEDFLQTDASHQSREFGRCIGEHSRRSCRHQLADPQPDWRQYWHRLRDPLEHGEKRYAATHRDRNGPSRPARRGGSAGDK